MFFIIGSVYYYNSTLASRVGTARAEPFAPVDRGETILFRCREVSGDLGPIAAHTARATFAANLFAAGGVEAVSDRGHSDPESVAAAFAQSGADVACICSSDDVYAELAEPAAAALKAAGAQRVYLAGKGEYAGVDEYIHLGVDALDILHRAEEAR